ncbi:ABC transporter permease [Psychrobium sp. 1_MG-2023]|uniref:ABC transporter permease n=1 Tax=Psychrobium sp. 1_MG-2023 TaxID=3062624 RepID=UPI002733ACBB|nr:ABC transporter permease [Psychrobium sp. 1_MG-2023]MDP2561284.1 ABC transporter permease [Psychrobium sp. 1_MG-2023]
MEMFLYYLRLSLRNLKRNSLFFTLMITTLAIGVGVLLANLAIIKSMASDPIPHKSSVIFNVSLSTWTNNDPSRSEPLNVMRYRDAMHILNNDIASQTMAHYQSQVYTRATEAKNLTRYQAKVRATTSGFFELTDTPFAYGSHWTSDNASQVVIGHVLNQQLFGGGNNLGKTIDVNDQPLTIVGILQPWHLKPLFYHADGNQAFNLTDDIYAPLETALTNEWGITVRTTSTQAFSSPSDTREKNVFYLQAFVQLDTPQQKASFQNYLDSYSQALKDAGEHPLAINNRLLDVNQWLAHNNVVDESMLAFGLATLLFLAVCIFNASSLLLARYHAARFETGLRRAVGASKTDIFYQGFVESSLIGLCCSALALFFGWVFLQLSLSLFPKLENMSDINAELIVIGVAIALFTSFISMLYPLIRACRNELSTTLK